MEVNGAELHCLSSYRQKMRFKATAHPRSSSSDEKTNYSTRYRAIRGEIGWQHCRQRFPFF